MVDSNVIHLFREDKHEIDDIEKRIQEMGKVPDMSDDSKYIDQRFENVDLKLEIQEQKFTSTLDRLCDKIDNLQTTINDVKNDLNNVKNEFKEDGKKTRTSVFITVVASLFTLFVGLGGILFMINQLQSSWIQEYLSVYSKALEALITSVK